jgi:hypothetical protein
LGLLPWYVEYIAYLPKEILAHIVQPAFRSVLYQLFIQIANVRVTYFYIFKSCFPIQSSSLMNADAAVHMNW